MLVALLLYLQTKNLLTIALSLYLYTIFCVLAV